MKIRKPIVAIMGHVDHGKTKILDCIRNTTVVEREAGAITQAIGASIVPISTIKRICGSLLNALNTEISVPGLLFIDTPGHAAFSNLRKRGGNLADIAILVIDINEGIKPQTAESLEILKKYKTPFIIAANKIDLVSGWRQQKELLMEDLAVQSDETRQLLDNKLYELVAGLYEHGFNAERFDRIDDHTKQVTIVPCCAKTGEGIPELLMLLTGLAQRYLSECLKCNTEGPAKGTVLEVKEEKGLGSTLDVIIYDGSIKVNDIIVIGNIGEPIATKVKALLEPKPLSEMRDSKSKFSSVRQAVAATGIKIAAKEIGSVIAGMPFVVANTSADIAKAKEQLKEEIDEVIIETEKNGIVIKADSLGSLEAMITLLKEKEIPIRKASVGKISKKDIMDAQASYEESRLNAVVLGFNVDMLSEASIALSQTSVKIFTNKVIYRLLEDFELWRKEEQKKAEQEKLSKLQRPFKIELMKGYVFRQSSPAVFGVDVLEGTIRTGSQLLKTDGSVLPPIKSIQLDKDTIDSAEKGKQVAVSVDGITIGRQLNEGDIAYSDIPEEDFRKLKGLKAILDKEEISLLKSIAEIKRKQNPLWGV